VRAEFLLGKLRVAHHNHFYKSPCERTNNTKLRVYPDTELTPLEVPELNCQRTHKNNSHVTSMLYPVSSSCVCVAMSNVFRTLCKSTREIAGQFSSDTKISGKKAEMRWPIGNMKG
jgi:hypothetical protein